MSQSNEKVLLATKIMSGAVTERFDLTQATQEWLRDGNNYEIMLQFEDGDSSHVRSVPKMGEISGRQAVVTDSLSNDWLRCIYVKTKQVKRCNSL